VVRRKGRVKNAMNVRSEVRAGRSPSTRIGAHPAGKPKPRSLPRIGVFLCYCGNELRDALDFDALERHVRTLPGVAVVTSEPYPCSRPGLASVKEAIRKHELERIVIAGCTPRLHGKLLSEACESAGVNRWLVDIANIREHCSRVHADKTEATGKAKSIVAASVEKVRLALPRERIAVTPLSSVLVIGGGVSGLSAAGELVSLGHEVTLIEKTNTLGGMLLRLTRPYPHGQSGKTIIEEKLSALRGKAEILKQTLVSSLSGAPGQYRVTLSSGGQAEGGKAEREFGAVIVATGADCIGLEELTAGKGAAFERVSLFTGRLLSQMDFEAEQTYHTLKRTRSAVFLEVLPGEWNHPALRLHSLVALKNAKRLKETAPDIDLSFVFCDVPSELERELREALDAGVQFVRHTGEKPPEFTKKGLRVGSGKKDRVEIHAEVVVLPVILEAQEGAEELSRILRVPADARGFYVEPHIKLRPQDFVERGIFVVGSCHSPATILECTAQAMAAASRASRFLRGEIFRWPFVSVIDEKVCRGCSRCAEECRWNAIEMETIAGGLKLARVDEALCTGCGVCSTVCICGAPRLAPVSQKQVKQMLTALGS
jgi:heterodisulfide reductase subunit A